MFKLELEPTFDATVQIPQPGGKRVAVRVRFNYLDAAAYTENFEAYRDKPAVEWVSTLVQSWATDDKKDQWHGMPEPYSLEALRRLFEAQPRAFHAFVDTYQHEVLGLPLKN